MLELVRIGCMGIDEVWRSRLSLGDEINHL